MLIQLENGKKIEFPDGTTPEQIDRVISELSRPQEKGFLESVGTAAQSGLTKRGIGLMQTAQSAGVPINKLFGVSPEQFTSASQAATKKQNIGMEGTGATGFITEAIADPYNLMPIGRLGKAALPVYGALSGLTRAEESGANTIPERLVSGGAEALLATAGGKAIEYGAKGITKAGQKAAQYIPESVSQPIATGAQTIADKLAAATKGSPFEKTTQKISENISPARTAAANLAKTQEKLDKPVGIYVDMLDNFKKLKDVNELNFDNLAAMSDKSPQVSVTPIRDYLANVVSELESNRAAPEAKGLPFMKRMLASAETGAKTSVSDVVELVRNLNSRFKYNKIGSQEAAVEAEVSGYLNKILGDYGKQNPDWRVAYDTANKFFKNNIAPLKDEYITRTGFDVRDIPYIEAFRRGELEKIPDEIKSRARQIHEKIIDDIGYERLAPLATDQKSFGELVSNAVKERRGISSIAGKHEANRVAAYGAEALAGGSNYVKVRTIGGILDLITPEDPLFKFIRQGVTPIGDVIKPNMEKAQRLAEMIAKKPPAGQKALPYYPKGYSPAETLDKYVKSLQELEAVQQSIRKYGHDAADIVRQTQLQNDIKKAAQDLADMQAAEGLLEKQAGVDAETYKKFLDIKPKQKASTKTKPSGIPYKDYQAQANKIQNTMQAKGKPMKNPDLANSLAEALRNIK